MNRKIRTIDDVIRLFTTMLSLTEPVGLAIEPIATMDDPDDEVKGDYSLRVSYAMGGDGKHVYIAVFSCYLSMGPLLFMPDNDYHMLLLDLLKRAVEFKVEAMEMAMNGGDKVAVYGSKGFSPDLGNVLKRAAEMMNATKH